MSKKTFSTDLKGALELPGDERIEEGLVRLGFVEFKLVGLV
jgi:hypothetical protein